MRDDRGHLRMLGRIPVRWVQYVMNLGAAVAAWAAGSVPGVTGIATRRGWQLMRFRRWYKEGPIGTLRRQAAFLAEDQQRGGTKADLRGIE